LVEAEAFQSWGRMLAWGGNMPAARGAFNSALDLMNQIQQYGIAANRASLLSDMTIAEDVFGDCAQARARLTDFLREVQLPGVVPETENSLRANLAQQLGNRNRCQFDIASIRVKT
jgi:hypothetical protein